MTSPFPFTVGELLTANDMNSIGETVSYTPALTNITLGNGTLSARYVLINNFVHYEGKITFGSTTSISGLNPQIAIPFASAQSFQIAGSIIYADSGVATFSGLPFIISTGTIYLYIANYATAYGNEVAVSATVPFTWGTSDSITWSIHYAKA
jgi:hypothetical protein